MCMESKPYTAPLRIPRVNRASLLPPGDHNSSYNRNTTMPKRAGKRHSAKRKALSTEKENIVIQPLPSVRTSDEPPAKKPKWTNKERVLVFSSRGISFRDRHLMEDFRKMMPHSKGETKMDRKDKLYIVNEIAEMKNCSKCIYFEAKKKQDLYMWVSNVPQGPSAKFLVENVHTMLELKMTGNCLKGTRPFLSFDKSFDKEPHLMLLKELFIQVYGTPNQHPKSQPFYDHVFTFTAADNRIWFRNYQILDENGELAEIGPRMVLNPIRIFEGSFGGPTLYQNPYYFSPNELRRAVKRQAGMKYKNRVEAAKSLELRNEESKVTYKIDPTDEVFQTH